MLHNTSYEPEKICLNWKIGEKHPLRLKKILIKMTNHTKRTKEPYWRSFKILSAKMWDFAIFTRRQNTDVCLFVVFFCIEIIVLEDRDWVNYIFQNFLIKIFR